MFVFASASLGRPSSAGNSIAVSFLNAQCKNAPVVLRFTQTWASLSQEEANKLQKLASPASVFYASCEIYRNIKK